MDRQPKSSKQKQSNELSTKDLSTDWQIDTSNEHADKIKWSFKTVRDFTLLFSLKNKEGNSLNKNDSEKSLVSLLGDSVNFQYHQTKYKEF